MARNLFFGEIVRSEQDLYEDIIIESIKIYGLSVFYCPRTIVNTDTLLQEDTESVFKSAFNIEMYMSTVENYEGDGILMSKFGLEIRNQVKLIVSKRRWDSTIGFWNQGFNNLRPSEGDLIYIPMVKGLFVIKYVELETPFYQLKNLPVYQMTCELFEYRGEEISTGVPEVDDVQNVQSTESSYRAIVAYTNNVSLTIDEHVTFTFANSTTADAKVTGITILPDSTIQVQFSNLKYPAIDTVPLATGTAFAGQESGSTGTIVHVINLDDGTMALSDGNISQQNSALQEQSEEILDFSESNPFGNPDDNTH